MKDEQGFLESKGCVEAIRVVTEILDDNNISYWMDYGVLLGLLRDGKMIPYDDDVDMGILANADQIQGICNIFRERGLKAFISDEPNNSIHFEKEGNGFDYLSIAHFESNIFARVMSVILCRFPTWFRRWMIHFIQRFYSNNEVVRPKTTKGRENNLFCWFARNMTSVLFCGSFATMDFYGYDVRVPEKAEELLIMRYGDDWRVPKRKGDYLSYTIDH